MRKEYIDELKKRHEEEKNRSVLYLNFAWKTDTGAEINNFELTILSAWVLNRLEQLHLREQAGRREDQV